MRLRERSLPQVATVVGGHCIRLPQGALLDGRAAASQLLTTGAS